MIKYETIEMPENGRTFVVGDLHGCYDILMHELNKVSFDKSKDLLISVGDLIDRGDKNIDCAWLLAEPWFKAVMGNHEDMFINCMNGINVQLYLSNGGQWTTKQPNNDLLELKDMFEKMPHVIILEPGPYVISHATFSFDSLEDFKRGVGRKHYTDPYHLLWERDNLERSHPDIIRSYHGHTPMEKSITLGNSRYIDTGAVFKEHGGFLTLEEIK